MKHFKEQILPIFLVIINFIFLLFCLQLIVHALNLLPIQGKVSTSFFISGIIVGATIYLKTSIDFALFIGKLMRTHPGWKNRVAIDLGTALGNSAGTIMVLFIWAFFKEIPILVIIMIILACLVLFRLAEESIEEYQISNIQPSSDLRASPSVIAYWKLVVVNTYSFLFRILHKINSVFSLFTSFLFPSKNTQTKIPLAFFPLVLFSFRVPFILGLDDFAGYIPIFTVVNALSFITGIFLGHMLLNLFLFLSPRLTAKIISQPVVSLFGGAFFLVIGIWGLIEAGQLIVKIFLG